MRRGYRTLINAELDLEVCGEAETAPEALESIPRLQPNVVIADISLEGMNGLEFIKRLRAEHPDLDVLVVSMHEESLYAERALQAGAAGYLMKKEADSQVVHAIRRVLDGRYFVSERMQDKIMLQFSGRMPRRDVVEWQASLEQLSDRELEVFELHGRGLSTREMAESMNISHKTVATHRGRIKSKLLIDTTPQLVRRAVLWIEEEKHSSDEPGARSRKGGLR